MNLRKLHRHLLGLKGGVQRQNSGWEHLPHDTEGLVGERVSEGHQLLLVSNFDISIVYTMNCTEKLGLKIRKNSSWRRKLSGRIPLKHA
jgi:hypothetical protein